MKITIPTRPTFLPFLSRNVGFFQQRAQRNAARFPAVSLKLELVRGRSVSKNSRANIRYSESREVRYAARRRRRRYDDHPVTIFKSTVTDEVDVIASAVVGSFCSSRVEPREN